jgi:hypothetical protein
MMDMIFPKNQLMQFTDSTVTAECDVKPAKNYCPIKNEITPKEDYYLIKRRNLRSVLFARYKIHTLILSGIVSENIDITYALNDMNVIGVHKPFVQRI